jgi:glycosyltransferase involved in cell wall biosynthesis
MRILFINRHDTKGGAAFAAYRLAKGLEQHYQHTVTLIVEHKHSNDPNVIVCKKYAFIRFIERIINMISSLLGLQYIWIPFSSHRILKISKEFQPDVISLHNIHGGYFNADLLKKLSRLAPIVWTLHDMWSFTSNAAYYEGAAFQNLQALPNEHKLFPSMGMQWSNFLLKRKTKIYKASNIHVVTPSRWLYHLAKKAPVFNSASISHIFYFLDHPPLPNDLAKKRIKEKLNIPNNACVILFNLANKSEFRKGPDLLLECLSYCDNALQSTVYCLAIGSGPLVHDLNLKHIKIVDIDYISNESELFLFYSISDIFLMTSRQDNSPLTLYESIAFNLACVAFDIGGCPDLIEHNVNGYLIPAFDTKKMAENVCHLITNPNTLHTMQQNCSLIWENKLSKSKTLDVYVDLIKSILQS